MNGCDALCVLDGKGSYGGHAVGAEGGEGFEVGLYSCTAGGVGACDGEGVRYHVMELSRAGVFELLF